MLGVTYDTGSVLFMDFPTSCILQRTDSQGLPAPIDLAETGYEGLDWIQLAENKDSWRIFGHSNAR